MPSRQRLQHQHIVVAIDDERGKQVGFAVHQPVGGGVEAERGAEREGRFEARAPERGVHRHFASRDHPQDDLRLIAEQRVAERSILGAQHADHGAGGGAVLDVADVGAVDPGMTGADAVLATGGDANGGWHGDQLSSSKFSSSKYDRDTR